MMSRLTGELMAVGESVTSTLERCALGSVLAGVIIVAGAFAPPASAEPDGAKEGVRETGPPALSIELSGDADQLRAGEEVEYTLSLANDGERELRGATLSQSLPAQLELVSAGEASVRSDGMVGWEVDVAPGDVVERALRVRVTEDVGDAWRLATTACAQVTEESPPVVCATDASLFDANAPAAPQPVAEESELSLAKVAGVAVVLAVIVAAFLAALVAQWRRRPSGRH